jgi:signal transduction histidine kinase
MAVWFGASFVALTAAFVFFSYQRLESELRKKSWEKDYPTHPDWHLHGSFSEEEVQDITEQLILETLLGSLPLVGLAIFLGYLLARKSLRPIAHVNEQLQAKTTANLGQSIDLPEIDAEFRDLLRHLNDLLTRLSLSFAEMTEYAAKVAHELRTPLAILRLKVEQAEGKICPELAEELQSELHRLSHVVDQSLLIARTDQGRVTAKLEPVDLVEVTTDIIEDFQLLALEDGRRINWTGPESCWVEVDKAHLRQIVHNLLSNALKHGIGNVAVRVDSCLRQITLLIANRKPATAAPSEATLGLGLRVVAALVKLDPQTRIQWRRGASYYVVRLSFRPAPAEIIRLPEMPSAKARLL